MGIGCLDQCKHLAVPALVTQIPARDGPKAMVQLWDQCASAGEVPVEEMGSRTGSAACSQRAGRRWVGAGKDWTQTKIFFVMKRKTMPLLRGLYTCMFFPLQ